MTDSPKPLSGVRVVDCTQMLSGPFTSQLLADLGADVVKVERPGIGDITRAIEPTLGDSDMTGYFAALNRGKRSVELDLGSDEGAAALTALAESADVLIENYRPGTMAKWGLGSETLRAANEDLIYCSISGFLPGPYRDLSAFDMVAQALAGSMSITGDADGPPARPGLPVGDICAGMYAAVAIVTGLYALDRQGGQHVEVPMFEGLVSWLTERAGRTFATGEPYPRLGTAHPSLAPYRVYPAAEGDIALAIGSEGTWNACCDAIGRPDLADDPRFETNADRVEHRDALNAELEPVIAERTAEEWFETFGEHGVPAAPVKDTVEVFEDPHLRESGTLSDLEIGGVDLPFVELPVTFSESETGADRAPPALGAHTVEVFSDVLSDEDVDSLL